MVPKIDEKLLEKGFVGGAVLALVNLFFGIVSRDYYYLTSNLMRITSANYYIAVTVSTSLLYGILFALFYRLIKKTIPGEGMNKGFFYGLLLFSIGPVPMIVSAMIYMNIMASYILIWLIQSFVGLELYGAIISEIEEWEKPMTIHEVIGLKPKKKRVVKPKKKEKPVSSVKKKPATKKKAPVSKKAPVKKKTVKKPVAQKKVASKKKVVNKPKKK